MRKLIITSCIAGSAFIILGQFSFFEALFAFLVAGAIPGTSYSIPSGIMYAFLIIAISVIIIRLIAPTMLDVIDALTDKNTSKKKTATKLPKRRYEQI